MTRSRLLLACILLLCLAGAWVSGDLVRQHAGAADGLLTRVCRAATGHGCAAALDSRWSTITVPVPIPARDFSTLVRRVTVPVAFLGLAYFAVIGTWFALLGAPRPLGRPWHELPLRLGYVSLPVSALFTGLMAVGAAPWCVLCLAVHVINALLVVAVWRLVRAGRGDAAPLPSTPEQLARCTLTTREVLVTVAVALAVVGGLWLHRRENLMHRSERTRLQTYETMISELRDDPQFLQREFLAQPRHDIPRRPTEVDAGRPRLVVFTDYQCPACICNHGELEDVAAHVFGGDLDVHVRHYPLPTHPAAEDAARFAEAVRLLGGDDALGAVNGLLFARRGRLDEAVFRELAAQVGLDPERVAARMDGDEVRAIVQADVELGDRLGVTGTPAMFLDGRPVTELVHTPRFWLSYAESRAQPPAVEIAGAAP